MRGGFAPRAPHWGPSAPPDPLQGKLFLMKAGCHAYVHPAILRSPVAPIAHIHSLPPRLAGPHPPPHRHTPITFFCYPHTLLEGDWGNRLRFPQPGCGAERPQRIRTGFGSSSRRCGGGAPRKRQWPYYASDGPNTQLDTTAQSSAAAMIRSQAGSLTSG